MKNLENKVKDCTAKLSLQLEDSAQLKAFQKTNDEFEALVKKGWAKKRGNNLLPSAEMHLIKPHFT